MPPKRKLEKPDKPSTPSKSTPNKRARGNGNSNGTPSNGAAHPDEEEEKEGEPVEHEYRVGAICRVKMTNFMTHVTLHSSTQPHRLTNVSLSTASHVHAASTNILCYLVGTTRRRCARGLR
jgi:hypothetical protein